MSKEHYYQFDDNGSLFRITESDGARAAKNGPERTKRRIPLSECVSDDDIRELIQSEIRDGRYAKNQVKEIINILTEGDLIS